MYGISYYIDGQWSGVEFYEELDDLMEAEQGLKACGYETMRESFR